MELKENVLAANANDETAEAEVSEVQVPLIIFRKEAAAINWLLNGEVDQRWEDSNSSRSSFSY